MAPPTAAVETRKSRRFMSTFGVVSTFVIMVGPPLSRLQLGRPVNGLADAQISSAATDVGHLGIDVSVGWLWLLLEQGHRRHDLPGLAVSALRYVGLDPRQLDSVRAVRRQ